MHKKSLQITDQHIDDLLHVNYLNYVRMIAEPAFDEYRARHGIDLPTLRDRYDLMLVISELKVRYFLPLKLGDVATMQILQPVIDGKSFQISGSITRGERLAAEIDMAMICVRCSTGRTAEIPEDIRENLLGFAA